MRFGRTPIGRRCHAAEVDESETLDALRQLMLSGRLGEAPPQRPSRISAAPRLIWQAQPPLRSGTGHPATT